MATAITKSKYENLRNRLAKIREEGRYVAKRGVGVAVSAVGGVGSGAIRASRFSNIPNTQIPTDVALGFVLAGVGVALGDDDVGEMVGSLGQGMLAGGLAFETRDMMVARQQRSAAA